MHDKLFQKIQKIIFFLQNFYAGVGKVSKFSLFHGGSKQKPLNVAKIADTFMKKVTKNYIDNMRKSSERHRQEVSHHNEDDSDDNNSAQATTMVYDLEIENKEENGDDTVVKKEVIVYDDPNDDIVYDDPNNDMDTLHDTQDQTCKQ